VDETEMWITFRVRRVGGVTSGGAGQSVFVERMSRTEKTGTGETE